MLFLFQRASGFLGRGACLCLFKPFLELWQVLLNQFEKMSVFLCQRFHAAILQRPKEFK